MSVEKERCRRNAFEALKGIDARTRCVAGRTICETILSDPFYTKAQTIAMYLAVGREVSLAGLMQVAWQHGKTICVPCREDGQATYSWGVLSDDVDYVKGPDGIMQPEQYENMDASHIDVALVPGLAFSETGVRLGRGGGFYDRLLSAGAGWKVGVAFGVQIQQNLPSEPHDVRMDVLVSEKEILNIEKLRKQ